MERAVKTKPVARPHPPREGDVEVEDVAPLEEEGALLREKELERRGPAECVDAGGALPDGIPAEIFLGVIVVKDVLFHAGGVEAEAEGGALVVVAIDDH